MTQPTPSTAMKIVFLDRATLSPQTVLRRPGFQHEMTLHQSTAPHQVAERIADADIVILNKVKVTPADLAAAPKLKLIAVAATGTDHVDLAACAARGVVVTNIRNYAKHSVPEHTFALIFALRHSVLAYHASVKAGRWQASGQFCFFDHPVRDIAGSTLGVIGDGALGKQVAAMGRALGMNVLFSAHKGRVGQGSLYTPFEEVLARADVLTLHCPLRAGTRNMIGAAEFALMRRKPLLINTGRGGLVDESAVGPALEAGLISGAGFDVVSVEPPPVDHPFMYLLDRPDFILTPHVAWASDEAVQGLANQLIDNIDAFFRGEGVNVVLAV